MIGFLDIVEGAKSGARMDEDVWNISLFRKMQELIEEYEISLSEEENFIIDNSLADRAFEAAVNFLITNGVYCISSKRVIKLTEGEIREAIKEIPDEIVVGEGRDEVSVRKREIEDSRLPNTMSAIHAPFSEELGPLLAENYARISRLEIIEGFNIPTIDGHMVYTEPIEVCVALRILAWMRGGIRKAGRPGMAITYYPISTRGSTLLAPINSEYGLRRTDGIMLAVLPDLKVQYEYITAAIVYENLGCYKVNDSGGGISVGGFCGGQEGAVIQTIADAITGWIVYHAPIHEIGIEDIRPAILMGQGLYKSAESLAHLALCRNTNIIRTAGISCSSGLCTEQLLHEIATRAVEHAINGANIYTISTRAHARRTDEERSTALDQKQTPLDVMFGIEVSDATIKAEIKRADGAEIIREIEKNFKEKPPAEGRRIQECYDLTKHKPSKEYEEIYKRVKTYLTDLGLKFE